ncbi:MAG: 50S ribosomal protein L13 [Planctomycetaceae bacterium]|nr:50S ribosomal protein L13 [Planctomycetaceae bacterium]
MAFRSVKTRSCRISLNPISGNGDFSFRRSQGGIPVKVSKPHLRLRIPVRTDHRSFVAKKEEVTPDWYVIDADGEIVGRLAVRIATVLMGKHKPIYTPHVDCGDFVVVLNAQQVRFSGKELKNEHNEYFTEKMAKKEYQSYTGYPGGRIVRTGADLIEKHPERILYEAVRRMLPKNKLGRRMLEKLKICNGPQHPHQAQNPQNFPEYVK